MSQTLGHRPEAACDLVHYGVLTLWCEMLNLKEQKSIRGCP